MALAVRHNYATNAQPAAVGDYSYSPGTEVSTSTLVTGATDGPLPGVTRYVRRTVTTALSAPGGTGFYSYNRAPAFQGVGDIGCVAVYVRSSHALQVQLQTSWRSSASASVGNGSTAPTVTLTPGAWKRLEGPAITAVAGAVHLGWWALITAAATLPAGGTFDITAVKAARDTVAGPHFDGATPATLEWSYAWDGAPYASSSTATEIPALTISAEARPASASVAITVRGGTPGRPLYVLRRDSAGTGIVRETSEGTLVWPALGDTLTITDHEARQGESTQYLLTDGDGVPVATVRLELPLWGTWLKSPGRPYRNTRVFYVGDSGITRAARRVVIDIENAAQRVVFARLRATPQGAIVVLTQTKAQAAQLQLLASDGLPLMLDTPTSWGVPFRYISVGDIGVERAYNFDGLRLEAEARRWTLNDVVQVATPQGVPTLDPGRTYADLPVLYSAYVAMPATNETYEQLATGMES